MTEKLPLTFEQTLILLAILTPINLFLWFHVGLGTFRAPDKPKTEQEGKSFQTADKCELRGLYSITRQILQLGGQTWR